MIEDFNQLQIDDRIKEALCGLGYTKPTPIQSEVIPHILEGRDCLAMAPTGTGKTCAFGVPAIAMTDTEEESIGTLVLCPTRELAMQTEVQLKNVAKNIPSLRVMAIYGGQNFERQLSLLRKRPHIVVGTPGRIMDHLRRKTLKLGDIRLLVLDEADEMLNMGFRDDINTILKSCNTEHQTVLFSATMSKEIAEISRNYQSNPVTVKTQHNNNDLPTIEQFYIRLKEREKTDMLLDIMEREGYSLALVFCNTKKRVDELNAALQSYGIRSEALHGDMKQNSRDRVMKRYRGGDIGILVATDVAARGIDVTGIEAVFNYDLPFDDEYYVHRIGRTARADRCGVSYCFTTERDMYKVKDFERYTKCKMVEMKAQGGSSCGVGASSKLSAAFSELGKPLDEYCRLIVAEFERFNIERKKTYTYLDLAAALLKNAMPPELSENNSRSDKKRRERPKKDTTRYFLNVGLKDNLDERSVRDYLLSVTAVPSEHITEVKLLDTFSFVELENGHDDEMLSLSGDKFHKRVLKVEIAGAEGRTGDKKKRDYSKSGEKSGIKLHGFEKKRAPKSDKNYGYRGKKNR